MFFLPGPGWHGEPVALAAEREGISPQELADRNTEKFRELMPSVENIAMVIFRMLKPKFAEQRARLAVERSQDLHPELDRKLVANYLSLMDISNTKGEWEESSLHLGVVREFARAGDDAYGVVLADLKQAAVYGLQGDWSSYLATREHALTEIRQLGDLPALEMQVSYFTWPLVFMGRYREAQQSSEEALRLADRLEEKELMITILESIGLALGMQDAFAPADGRCAEAWNFYDNFHLRVAEEPAEAERYVRAMLSFRGLIRLRAGLLDGAVDAGINGRRRRRGDPTAGRDCSCGPVAFGCIAGDERGFVDEQTVEEDEDQHGPQRRAPSVRLRTMLERLAEL